MPKSERLIRLLLLLPPLLGALLLAFDPRPLQQLRLHVFDQYQRWQPRSFVETPVRIVDIDEASLKHLGQWPWPRTRLAELVERLQQAGVAAIGFDTLFAEADRTSPALASRQWSLNSAQRQMLASLPDHDQAFAGALAQADVVLGFVAERQGPPPAQLPVKARVINIGPPAIDRLHAFQSMIPVLPVLEAATPGYGAFTFVPDEDGVLRRVPLVLGIAGQTAPTLVSETLRLALGEKNLLLRSDGDGLGLSSVRIGQFDIPTNASGEMWLHYSKPTSARYLPAWQVLNGSIPASTLSGQIILIGSSAQGLMDLRFNSLGRIMPGVEAHAQALEQILSGHFLQRPGWALALETLLAVFGGLLIVTLCLRWLTPGSTAALLGLLGALSVGSWLGFVQHGYLLDPAGPGLVIGLGFTVASLYRHRVSEREQRWIKEAFSRYVSPNRVAYLLEHRDSLQLGGKRQSGSFIFTDLANFTSLMEDHDPAVMTSVLNAYLDGMIAIVFKHEGTLDRIIGDAVAAVFSAPVEQADHAARAYACALEMYDFATRFAADCQQQGLPFGHTRIGVHTGEVIVGNFGGSSMFDYRALGDAVNTAARLESVNKHLGTRFCVSAATLAGVPEAAVRPTARLILKGRHQALATFEPLPAAADHAQAPLAEYLAAYQSMADNSPTAAGQFAILAERWPDDPLVALHHDRLQAGEQGDVIVMHEK